MPRTSRRRGAALEDALLDAAWEELAERGYDDFAIESVAERASTSRAVIYRRWPTKPDIVYAAIAHRGFQQNVDLPDTGSLRGDMIEFMSRANRSRARLGLVLITRLGAFYADTGTSLATLRETFLKNRHQAARTMLQRAAQRGEIDQDKVTERVARVAFDLYLHELMMTLRPVPDDVIASIIDEVFLPLVRRD